MSHLFRDGVHCDAYDIIFIVLSNVPSCYWPDSFPSQPSCGVTDITYYREVDQSHLHLVEAQSTMRKFLLKLAEREKAEEVERTRRSKRALAGGTEVEEVEENETTSEPVQVSTYIERGPSDILR